MDIFPRRREKFSIGQWSGQSKAEKSRFHPTEKKREKSDHCKAQICWTVLPTASLILQSFASWSTPLLLFWGFFQSFSHSRLEINRLFGGGTVVQFLHFPFWVRSSSKSPRLHIFPLCPSRLFLIRSNQLEDIFSYKYTFVCLTQRH